ncbi:hypothetical protein HUJ05_001534 [Dendroctonus ponderosae]|nr:hypothetical protein HUJ05_001534 [Dendroctonus ponderosae]
MCLDEVEKEKHLERNCCMAKQLNCDRITKILISSQQKSADERKTQNPNIRERSQAQHKITVANYIKNRKKLDVSDRSFRILKNFGEFSQSPFQGSFARLPHQMTFLRKDLCQPSSCTVALCIQLGFLLTIRTFMGNICTAIYPPLKNILRSLKEQCCRKVCQKNPAIKQTLPQWEEEYYLEPLDTYSVTEEFSEMGKICQRSRFSMLFQAFAVIRFGYITFFSKAFPLAALCALLNNLIELRSDAYKFVKSHRRVVPVEKSGIGAWNGILRSLSYISTAINAFVIAFTSDWVETEVYRQTRGNGSLKGFVNSTLSKYATSDNRAYHSVNNREEFCYFRGNYYPPENPTKYGITQLYWMNLMFKFVAVFLFEHVMLLCNTLFTYCLSYKPESVQLQLDLIRHKEKEMRLTECERKLEERVKSDTKLSKVEVLDGAGLVLSEPEGIKMRMLF